MTSLEQIVSVLGFEDHPPRWVDLLDPILERDSASERPHHEAVGAPHPWRLLIEVFAIEHAQIHMAALEKRARYLKASLGAHEVAMSVW